MSEPRKLTGSTGMVKSTSNKIIDLVVVFICLIAIAVCLLPLLNVLATSLSSQRAVTNNWVYFWPVELDLESYKSVFRDSAMRQSMLFSVGLTIVSTCLSMLLTVLCAYPLSQKKFVGRTAFNTIIILTMYFNAGIIPDYLNIKRLGILDTAWALILPVGISVFNMIILKSFFMNLPESLKESAELDGANHWTILFRIFLPLSTPALATIALFYAVGRWNGFQDVRIYITSPALHTIQFRLYQVIQAQAAMDSNLEGVAIKVATESLKSASIMFATIPILIVYPWLQKYFVAGVTVGAVKG